MVSTKAMLSSAASLAASVMLVRTIVNDFLPHRIQSYIFSSFAAVFGRLSSDLTIVVDEFINGFTANEMYPAVEVYLGTKISPSTRRLKVSKQENEKALEVTVEESEVVVDVFEGAKFTWHLVCHKKHQQVLRGSRHRNGRSYMSSESESRSFVLSFHKRHRNKALDAYLHHILEQSKTKKEEDRSLKLHTARYDLLNHSNAMDIWAPVNLDHPATFETLAMDVELKREVMEDLQRFVTRKGYYRRVGKAWKRGYLLYGPPGTGKSSLIAAMANYLKFDVYDLELTEVRSNSNLRKLMVATANRSILVVEDIDCTLELEDRKAKISTPAVENMGRRSMEEKVTLSGLLNFIDGLWSSCGNERIIVFTTNHKERLDPALLRPGRMDMHVHMGYCSPYGFMTLAANYHGVHDHPLFGRVEGLLREVQVTPAEVAEELMKSDNVEMALKGLVKFVERKKEEAGEAKEKDEGAGSSQEPVVEIIGEGEMDGKKSADE
uniref:Putative mitochondrial chaperone BCS1-B n=1 Tax=Anthurium amnicola TaxID=1678845 RepID=A0A1D1YVQ6_9ARAE